MRQLSDYPSALTDGRTELEGSFIFSLWNDPDLYGDFSKVNVGKDETILTDDGQFYFHLGRNLYEQGYRKFDHVTLATYLESFPEVKAHFEELGGYGTVKDLMSITSADNADGYFDNISKYNMLMDLHDIGFDVMPNISKLKRMTSQQAYDFFDYQLNSIALKSNHDFEIETLELDDEFIAECNSGAAKGISYARNCPILNSITMGLPLGELYMIGAHSGGGKALAVTEPVMTPTGPKPMESIKLGDYVIGEDGKKTKVIGVFPQGKRDAYKITFSDGCEVICDKEHLWKYRTIDDNRRKNPWRVETLGYIMENHQIRTKAGARNIRIPRQQAVVDFESKGELIIPPYSLGLLLGDGYLARHGIHFTNPEQDLLKRLNDEMKQFGQFEKVSYKEIQYPFKSNTPWKNKLVDTLRELELFGTKSGDKFIPERYLYASYEDRLALARGLIDTDGSIDKKGHINFCSSSKKLRDDVAFLIRSLGFRVTLSENHRADKGSSYELFVCGHTDLLFSSEKHIKKYEARRRTDKKYYEEQVRIEKIEKLDKQVEMQCIAVDNTNHTYLCGDFIVTHNTSFVFENMILPITKSGVKCTVISNEQRSKDFKILLLIHVLTKELNYWDLTRKNIKQGGFTPEQMKMIQKARKIISEKYGTIRFVKLFDNNMDKIYKIIKKLSKVGHQVFMFDTMKSEDAVDEAMWQQLLLHSRKLFQLASRENVSIVCSYQLALHTSNRRYLDASCLSNSKQIKEVFSEMIYFRTIWDDEYSGEKCDLQAYQMEKDESGKYTNTKVIQELDKEKRYIVAFVDKTRNDEDKQQVLYEFNGRFNNWKEVGYCHVVNDHNW